MQLPSDVIYILDTYRRFGHEAFVVGGPVRDALLGGEPKDYDLTTDATPEETLAIFHDRRVVETGIAHGTLTLVLNGVPYEITTYRIDGEYSDYRHPVGVTFTRSLKEDLARRDFTVNAMAYHPDFGVVDPFDGTLDLSRRLLRAVGEPRRRFEEDALRILRGLRFAAVLGFAIEDETAAAMRALKHLVQNVSVERVLVEVRKLLVGKAADAVLGAYGDILTAAIPELCFSLSTPLPDALDADGRLVALIAYSRLSRSEARALLERLHTDRALRTLSDAVLSVLDMPKETDFDLLMMARRVGYQHARIALIVDDFCRGVTTDTSARLADLSLRGVPVSVSELAIGGADVVALGIRGERVGRLLDEVLTLVMQGKLENEREPLLAALCELAGA